MWEWSYRLDFPRWWRLPCREYSWDQHKGTEVRKLVWAGRAIGLQGSLNKGLMWSPRELWSWGEGTIPLYLCWPVTGCGLYRKGTMTRPPALQRNSLERTDSLGLLPRHPQQLEHKSFSSGGESGQHITTPSTTGLRTLVWDDCQWIGGDSPRLGHRGGSQSR